MAIDEKLLSFTERLRATLDAVNAELAAKGVAEAGDYSAIPAAVRSIEQGASLPTQEKSVSPSADVREVVPDEGYTLSKVTVGAAPLESGSATPAASAKTYYPASGKYGFSQFEVGAIPSSYVQPTSTQAAKTWTPTTSTQSIPAGTYCSGKQTIGAIPSDYIKPTSKQSGGTYTLDPGESLSSKSGKTYGAGTYLTSALSVTAAESSGGSGTLGSYIRAIPSDRRNITFSASTSNLAGFVFYGYFTSNNLDGEEINVVTGGFYYSGTVHIFYTSTDEYGSADWFMYEENPSGASVTINTNNIKIALSDSYYFDGSSSRYYYLYPIYSA